MYKVTRDGKRLFTGTENECWKWLLNHQAQSTDWAIKYEGYKIEKCDRPEYGKQYSLTGGHGQPCILNGNSWKESEVK